MNEIAPTSLVVCGLPGSGKTTFLAALWHLVQSQEIKTALGLHSLAFGEYEYVNSIRKRWQRGEKQVRTVGAARRIGLDLEAPGGRTARLIFLDHSGETFDRLWETRSCRREDAEDFERRSGIALFLRSEGFKAPVPLSEMLHLEKAMREALPEGSDFGGAEAPQGREWSAENTPDQVKLVDLLQSLTGELEISKNERLAVIVSAWDRVDDYASAEDFVRERLPFLSQYLRFGVHPYECRFYAVSAQGGEYVEEDHEGVLPQELAALLSMEQPSGRIRLLDGVEEHCDLTLPLAWIADQENQVCTR